MRTICQWVCADCSLSNCIFLLRFILRLWLDCVFLWVWNGCFQAISLITSFVGTAFFCTLLLQRLYLLVNWYHYIFLLNDLVIMNPLVSLGWDNHWWITVSGWKLLGMDWDWDCSSGILCFDWCEDILFHPRIFRGFFFLVSWRGNKVLL